MQHEEKRELPRFRKDLTIYRGPKDADGSPTYNVHDPVAGRYYKLTWKESLVFRCFKPGMTPADLARAISSTYPVDVSETDVHLFYMEAYRMGLLRVPASGEHLAMIQASRKQSWWAWLLHHYLYIRIPLVNPDRFLTRTLGYVEPLLSRPALFLYAVVIAIGLFLLATRLDQFWMTAGTFFNAQGLICYLTAVTAVKIVHELAHAYTAKHYKLYVPAMGVAFLVLWPVLFTDVTEGWKLAKRKQRFAISFAGIAAESVIAGFSTLGWALSGPGIMQTVFFLLATTSWISTLVININPAVRFDGYYILSDLWGIDNLQPRAFAVARWKFHRWLFGVEEDPPEDNLSPRRIAGMVAYSVYTVIYRFFLYTAIALFVYFEFTKILGIFLFLVEVLVFFCWPIIWEGMMLYSIRSKPRWNARTILAAGVCVCAVFWFVVPLPHTLRYHGVIAADERQVLYAPVAGRIKSIDVALGDSVVPGTKVASLESLPLAEQLAIAAREKQQLETEVQALAKEPEKRNFLAEKRAQLAAAEAEYAMIAEKKKQLGLQSSLKGQVISWNEGLREGQYLAQGAVLGVLANTDKILVIAYVPDEEIAGVGVGQRATVVSTHPFDSFQARVARIGEDRTSVLDYPSLASVYGGPLIVAAGPEHEKMHLVDSYYTVALDAELKSGEKLRLGQTVEVRVRGPWRSYVWELAKGIMRVLTRESAF